jgi:hypothetical protein
LIFSVDVFIVSCMGESPTPAGNTNCTDPPPDRPAASTPNRTGQLIDLVRKLMEYATGLAVTLRERIAANEISPRFNHRFGTKDIALILARITRGLLLATALEARLIARIDRKERVQPEGTTSTAAPRKPRTGPRKPSRVWQPDPRLAGMPTEEEIAAEVRRRPVGAVLADICLDLGIVPADPLWRELQQAIMFNGGSLARLFNASWKLASAWMDDLPPEMRNARLVPPYPLGAAMALGTGPP